MDANSVGIPPVRADSIVAPMPAVVSDGTSAIAEGAITTSGVHPEACSSLPRQDARAKHPSQPCYLRAKIRRS